MSFWKFEIQKAATSACERGYGYELRFKLKGMFHEKNKFIDYEYNSIDFTDRKNEIAWYIENEVGI